MDAVKFLKEEKRMYKSLGGSSIDCDGCPHAEGMVDCCVDDLERRVKIVEDWATENPAKTYKDDFLEKYPNAPLKHSGEPRGCIVELGYIKTDGTCARPNLSCRDCWNTEMEE